MQENGLSAGAACGDIRKRERSAMKCSVCGNLESRVIDSRQSEDGAKIRRRRECLKCGARFTTYEEIEMVPLMVVKRDKSREPFDREKLRGKIQRACVKRPVSTERIDRLISEIEAHFANQMVKEIPSSEIGRLVLQKLRDVDEVAYIRFASVYRDFADLDSFLADLQKMRSTRG